MHSKSLHLKDIF